MIIRPSLSCIYWLEFVYRMVWHHFAMLWHVFAVTSFCLQNGMTSFCYAMTSFCRDLILDVHYDIITSENDVASCCVWRSFFHFNLCGNLVRAACNFYVLSLLLVIITWHLNISNTLVLWTKKTWIWNGIMILRSKGGTPHPSWIVNVSVKTSWKFLWSQSPSSNVYHTL